MEVIPNETWDLDYSLATFVYESIKSPFLSSLLIFGLPLIALGITAGSLFSSGALLFPIGFEVTDSLGSNILIE
jgi:hypothetical protein